MGIVLIGTMMTLLGYAVGWGIKHFTDNKTIRDLKSNNQKLQANYKASKQMHQSVANEYAEYRHYISGGGSYTKPFQIQQRMDKKYLDTYKMLMGQMGDFGSYTYTEKLFYPTPMPPAVPKVPEKPKEEPKQIDPDMVRFKDF